LLEIDVRKRTIIYCEDFGKWVVKTEGALRHPDGLKPYTGYGHERFGTQREALQFVMADTRKLLEAAIERTKAEDNVEKKETLFREVMRLAWEDVGWIRMIHPREYIYRDLCKNEKENPDGSNSLPAEES